MNIFYHYKINNEIKEIAIQVIKKEKKAIENLEKYIDDDFSKAIKTIFSSKGRVIITGIGKSSSTQLIQKKIIHPRI